MTVTENTAPLSKLTHDIAAANILTYAREGRLRQGTWHGKGDDGQQIACLLGAIHPKIDSASDCPAKLMPYWLARLTVRLFDGIPADQVYVYGEAYAQRLHCWSALDAAAWGRVRLAFITEAFGGVIRRAEAKVGAAPAAAWPAAKAVADKLLALLLRGNVSWAEYREIREEAYAARRAAWTALTEARAKALAAAASAPVAEAAAEAVVAVVAAVAEAAEAVAAEAVAVAVEAVAEAVAVEAVAVAVAARRASYRESFDVLFQVIDTELDFQLHETTDHPALCHSLGWR